MLALGIVAAGLAAYANSFAGILVFDDEPAIVGNPHIRRLWPIADAMSAPRDTTLSGRPVASLTFAINYALAPDAVRDALTPPRDSSTDARLLENLHGYHLVNLAIHLLASLALFGTVRRTLLTAPLRERAGSSASMLAAAIAAIWVVHPLQTGSVTYLVQRVESLMGLFYLLTMYCAIRAIPEDVGDVGARGDRTTQRLWTAAAIVACALGMGTKEVMVTAPLIVVMWDAIFARGQMRARWPLYLALAFTWIVLAVLVAGGPRSFSVGFGFAEWPWWRYLITQAGVLLHYLRLSIVASPLVLDYEWRPATLATAAPAATAIAVLLAVTAWGLWRRAPWAFAGAWFFLILAPTSSVLPIVTEVAAEHRMYLPLAAVISLVIVGGFILPRRLTATAAGRSTLAVAGVCAVGIVTVAFGTMTYARNADYQNFERIWLDTITKRPDNARARNNYASALLARRAFQDAVPHLRTAIELNPDFAEAHANLGVALCAQAAFDEGIASLLRAIALRPGYAPAHRNLAEAYGAQGRVAHALEQYLAALQAQPDDVDLVNRAAWILSTAQDASVRNGARARQLAEHAVGLTKRQDVISLDTLAAALAEQQRFTEAVAIASEALRLARAKNDQAIVPELELRLSLYRAGQPFRQ